MKSARTEFYIEIDANNETWGLVEKISTLDLNTIVSGMTWAEASGLLDIKRKKWAKYQE